MFTLAAKADEPGLIEAARILGVAAHAAAARGAQRAGRTHPYAFRGRASALRRAQHRRGRRARRRRRRRTAAWAAARRRRRDLRRRPIPGAAMRRRATRHDDVHFIGAGPGAPDLITVRGRDLIARSPVCLYAGSLDPARACSTIARQARGSSTPRRSISTRSSRSASKRPRAARTSRGSIRATSRSSARWASNCGA